MVGEGAGDDPELKVVGMKACGEGQMRGEPGLPKRGLERVRRCILMEQSEVMASPDSPVSHRKELSSCLSPPEKVAGHEAAAEAGGFQRRGEQ